MPSPYNLTAELNLRLNADSVASSLNTIQRALAGLPTRHTVNVGVNVQGLSSLRTAGQAFQNIGASAQEGASRAAMAWQSLTPTMQGFMRSSMQATALMNQQGTAARAMGNALYDAYHSPMRQAAISLRTLSTLTGQVVTLAASYRLLRAGLADVVELESKLAGYAQVSETSVKTAQQGIGREVRGKAVQYGVPSPVLLESATTLRQAGLSESATRESMGLMSKLALNSQIGVKGLDDAAKAVVVYREVWKQTGPEVEDSFERIIRLAKETAIESNELVRSASILSSTFKQLGGSAPEMEALVTSVKSATQLDVSVVGQGLKTLLTRISSMPAVTSKLRGLGVELFPAGQFVGPIAGLQKIKTLLDSLPEGSESKQNLLMNLGGVRQVGITTATFQQLPKALALYNEVLGTTGGLAADAARQQDTLQNQLVKTRESFGALFQTIYDNSLKGIASDALTAARSFAEFGKQLTPLLPLLSAFAVNRVLATQNIQTALAMPVTARGIGQVAAPLAVGGAVLAASMTNNAPASESISGGATGYLLGASLSPFTGALLGATLAVKGFASGLEQSRKDQLDARAGGRQRVLELAGRSTGSLTSPQSLGAANNLLDELATQQKAAYSNAGKPGFWESYARSVFTLNSPEDTQQQTVKARRRAVVERAQNASYNLLDIREELAKKSNSYSDFRQQAGGLGGRLEQWANIAGIPDFKASTEKLIKARLDEAAQTERAKQAAEKTALSLGEFSRVIGAQSYLINQQAQGVIEGTQQQRIYLPTDVQRYAPRFAEGMASPTSPTFTATVNRLPIEEGQKQLLGEVSRAQRMLPGIFANTPAKSGFVQNITNELKQQGIGQGVVSAIESQLHGLDVTQYAKGLSDLDGLTHSLLGSFSSLLSSTQHLGTALDQRAEQEHEQLGRAFGLRESAMNATSAAQSSSLAYLQKQNEFALHRPLAGGSAIANQIVLQQAKGLAGTDSVDQLSGQLTRLVGDIQGGTGTPAMALQVNSTVNALKLLADSTARLRGTQDELAHAESSRRAKLNFVEGYFSSDLPGRLQIAREMGAAQRVTRAGTILGVPVQTQQLAIAGLRRVAGADNVFGTGKTGQEILDRLMGQAGGKMIAGEDNQIAQLQRQTLTVLADSAKAQQALAQFEGQLQQTFFQNLSEQNRAFLAGLGQVIGRPVKDLPDAKLAPLPAMPPLGPMPPGVQAPQGAQGAGIPQKGPGGPGPALQEIVPPGAPADRTELLQRRRAEYLANRLEAGASPTSLSLRRAADNLTGFRPDRFSENNKPYVMQMLSLRTQGYHTDEIRSIVKQRIEFERAQEANTKAQKEAAEAPVDNGGAAKAADKNEKAAILFNQAADRLEKAIAIIPADIKLDGRQDVNVNLNGAEIMTGLQPGIVELVEARTGQAMSRYARDSTKPPELRV